MRLPFSPGITGASFKLNSQKPGYVEFLAADEADIHSWNVVRSEADGLIFKYARESGAKFFDGATVEGIQRMAGQFLPRGREG
ncbi:hypothetical protein BDV10DRAFT_182044 [Aspergillus recurvatus]